MHFSTSLPNCGPTTANSMAAATAPTIINAKATPVPRPVIPAKAGIQLAILGRVAQQFLDACRSNRNSIRSNSYWQRRQRSLHRPAPLRNTLRMRVGATGKASAATRLGNGGNVPGIVLRPSSNTRRTHAGATGKASAATCPGNGGNAPGTVLHLLPQHALDAHRSNRKSIRSNSFWQRQQRILQRSASLPGLTAGCRWPIKGA